MWRHVRKFCKVKKENDNNVKELKSIVLEQKDQINKLIKKVGTTNITNNNINNTQNIQLNSYGNEDMSHITDSMKSQLLKLPYGMIPKMIEAVHFNKNKPENKNIAFPNKKENKIKIYRNNKWIYRDKDEIINDLMDGKYFILDCHYEEICNNMVDNNISEYNKSGYEKFKKIFDKNDKELHEQLKKECEFVLLNNR